MDPVSLETNTGVWFALSALVEKTMLKMRQEELTPSELKDLSTTLSNIAKVEIQATMASRPPGRPTKDPGDNFPGPDLSELAAELEEPSDG